LNTRTFLPLRSAPLSVLLLHDAGEIRPIGVRDLARRRHVGRKAGEIETFEGRAVARHIRDHARREIDHADFHQPQDFRALEAVHILGRELGRDLAARFLRNALFPERLLAGLEAVEMALQADNLQMGNRQVLGQRGRCPQKSRAENRHRCAGSESVHGAFLPIIRLRTLN